MHCLFCFEQMPQMSWKNIFKVPNKMTLCYSCKQKLQKINISELCKRCNGKLVASTCIDCKEWEKIYAGNLPLIKNRSIFKYNSFLKEVVTQWKYRGDYVLAQLFKEVFRRKFIEYYSHLKKYKIVPIPLSATRLKERGFNQSAVLASFLTTKITNVLKRIHTEKQAKKSRHERMKGGNPFTCIKHIKQPVILIDDIYTTGATVHAAAEQLRLKGCKDVYSFTLIRG